MMAERCIACGKSVSRRQQSLRCNNCRQLQHRTCDTELVKMPKHKSFPGCFSENKQKRRCTSDLTENPDSEDETRQLIVELKQHVSTMEADMRRTMVCLASPVVDKSIKLTEVRRQLRQQEIYLRKTKDFLYTDPLPVVELETDMDSSLSSTTGRGYDIAGNIKSQTCAGTSEKFRYKSKVTEIVENSKAQSDAAIEKPVETVKKSAEASEESTKHQAKVAITRDSLRRSAVALEQSAEHPAKLAITSDSFGTYRLAASSEKLSVYPAKDVFTSGSFGTRKAGVASEELSKVAIKSDSFGTLVWSRFTQKRWWPAFIIDGVTAGLPPAKLASAWLMWFGDHKVSQMKLSQIQWIGEKFLQRAIEKEPKLRDKAVAEALKECAARLGIVCGDDNVAQIAKVIQAGLTSKAGDPVAPTPDWSLPLEFTDAIKTLKARQNDQKAKTALSKVSSAPASAPAPTLAPTPTPVDKASTLSVLPATKKGPRKPQETQAAAAPVKVFSEKDVEQYCLGCGRGLEEGTFCCHPLFEGKLCSQCQDLVSEAVFSMDARGYYDRCCVCGADSDLKVCTGNNCARAYCEHCLEKFGVSSYYEKTRATWQCSLCTLYRKSPHGLLRSKTDWEHNLVHFFNLEASNVQLTVDKYSILRKERGIRVLSLADGIAAVRVALHQLAVNVDAYYTVDVGESTSLDKVAREIVTNQHENWVVHLGDLLNLEKRKLQEIAPIDLIVMNKATMYWNGNKDFNEAQGLLLKFLLALKQLKLVNPAGTHVFWLLESSVFISASCRRKVSKLLKVPSCMWDSQFFAPVIQPKLYWGNLPGLHRSLSFYKEHRCHDSLETYLDNSQQRKPKISRVRPTAVGGLLGSSSQTSKEHKDSACPSTQFTHPILMDGSSSQISVQEMERLMGFPEHYADCQAEANKRLQLLASSSVFVLKQLLTPLKDLFSKP